MTRTLLACSVLALAPAAALAQDGRFAIIQGGKDTVASESFTRDSSGISGTVLRGTAAARERIKYHLTLIDGTAPLIELAAWRGDDPAEARARQNVRIIFKDDSVAVDEANDRTGVNTQLFQTQPNAVPYLNLSTVFLELATRRARTVGRDSVAIPFFNLSGGQTVTGVVRKVGSDSATLQLGGVLFRLKLDPAGGILGGTVPGQGLVLVRGAAP
jgi:hypothetical protein